MLTRMTAGAGVGLMIAATTASGGGFEARPFADDPALAHLPAKWAGLMEQYEVPGAAVAVVKDGEVFIETFGLRDGERPVTPETMFYIASITKTFNAMAVCALADDGRLSLDDRVKDILPAFDLPEAHNDLESRVTVRDLLCHRYGINSGPIVGLDAYTGEITDERYWHWLARGEVAGEPQYTNVNYTLAGKVVERVTGGDWRDWLDERVLTPAGMTRTTGYASRLYGDDDCAIPTEWGPDGFEPTEQRKTDRTMHAAGGLGISAEDGARWILLNLNDGEIGGTRVLAQRLAREMKAEQATRDPEGSIRVMEGFGLGWQTGRYADAPMLAHGGGYAGTNAYVALHPEQNAGFFMVINAAGLASGWGNAVAVDCSRALTGMDPEWEPWERYPERIEQIKQQRAERWDEPEPAVTGEGLSRPIGQYTGHFRNEWLGTLTVTREGDTLAFAMGEMPLDGAPGEDADAFLIGGLFNENSSATFVVGPGGEVDAVRVVDSEGDGTFVFER